MSQSDPPLSRPIEPAERKDERPCVECGKPASGRKKYADGRLLCDLHYGLGWDMVNAEVIEDYEWLELLHEDWDNSLRSDLPPEPTTEQRMK